MRVSLLIEDSIAAAALIFYMYVFPYLVFSLERAQ